MKSLLRIVIVWFALLAVPFQGFAAAAAFGCAHETPKKAVASMLDGHACHHHDAAKTSHHDGKCSNCAACCIGIAIAPPVLAVASPPAASGRYLIADTGQVPSADPDHPERPPRFARA